MPRFTVIIPTYNWSSVLRFSIGSVLQQTDQNFELLVVGDGCTDDSETIVNAIGDSRVHWLNLPANSGHQSAANNEGIRRANGQYVAYLGHDDLWLPHHLAILGAALDRGAALAFSVTAIINVDGTRTPAPQPLGPYVRGVWIPPTGVAHRREAAVDAGGWPLFADVDCDPELALWERIHDQGGRLEFVRRLTAIKFSAAMRKNSYALQSTEEQALWSRRIATEPDLELTELVNMLVPPPATDNPFSKTLRAFGNDTASRIRRRLFGRAKASTPATREALFNQRREFKGLMPKAPPGKADG